jgi:hypothetical protein
MCREMSQSIPNRAMISEPVMVAAGMAAQALRPLTRSENAPSLPSRATLPLRWPIPM